MTKDELEQKLAAVAEFRMPKLSQTVIEESKQKIRGKGRPSREEEYQEEHQEVFLDLFQGINPTHQPELVKMHIKPVDCEDCGRHCETGRQMEIKFYPATTRQTAHRRDRCVTCNRYRDPYTGKYTLTQGPASQIYLNWACAQWTAKKKQAKNKSDK